MLARAIIPLSALFFGALLLMGLNGVGHTKSPADAKTSLIEQNNSRLVEIENPCQDTLNVVVTVAPIAQIVRDIGGQCVHVETLISPGADPHHYALKPSDIKTMRSSDGVVWLGPTLEPFLKKNLSKLPAAKQLALETSVLTADLHFQESHHEHEHEHEHGHRGDHVSWSKHEALDPHIWFSLSSRRAMVTAIADWLTEKAVGSTVTPFHTRADEMNRQWQQKVVEQVVLRSTDLKRRSILVDHNAYSYLFEELGLKAIGAVQPNHEIKASIKHILALKTLAKQAEPLCVVVQPYANEALIKKILNGAKYRITVIDPMLRLHLNEKSNKASFSSIQSIQRVVSELLECTEP